MKTDVIAAPCWSTSCFGDTAQTSPMELSQLGDHLQHCSATPGVLVRLRFAAEALDRFVGARFVTTLALLSLPTLLLALLL